MKKTITLLFFGFFALSLTKAQTMWVINYCNTLDPKIGKSCEVDYERFNTEMQVASSMIDYTYQPFSGTGSDCSKERLMNTIKSIQCSPNDIIIFYYSGHGVRSPKDNSPFPQMCLKYGAHEQENFVAVHQVVDMIKQKNVRFALVITDCCNSNGSWVSAKSPLSQDGGTIVADEKLKSNYKKLFLERKGMVVTTSSKVGQTSGCNNIDGGFWSKSLLEYALNNAILGKIKADWNTVLNNAAQIMSSNGISHQPYYEVNLGGQQTAPTVAPSSTPVVVSVNADFAQAIQTVFTPGLTKEQKLAKANQLAEQYFSIDAMVATVGRNGTTVVDMEKVKDFLRRIAMSSFIKQINIIDEKVDSTGKRTYLKVQEIRTK